MIHVPVETEPYILFELAGTTYALATRQVQHVEMIEHVTPIPNAPAYVEGIVFSRGQVVPVVNLRSRFGFPKQARTTRERLIVVRLENRNVGFLVDAAREFLRLSSSDIQPPHDALAGLSGNYLAGIVTAGDRLILILDLEKLLRTTGAESVFIGSETSMVLPHNK